MGLHAPDEGADEGLGWGLLGHLQEKAFAAGERGHSKVSGDQA